MRKVLAELQPFDEVSANRCILILIFLLAFLLRADGLGFGLPYLFHDDEHQYVEAGIAFLQDRETAIAELQKLNNPPLFKSVLGFLYTLWTHILILNPEEIQTAVDTQAWHIFFQYMGRLASASAGLLTVALLYALGKRLYGRKTGILAALLLAVSFLHVRESHFAVNDAPLTFLAVSSLYAAAGILRRGSWFDYLMTGFLIGLAAATKYTGIQLVSVLLVTHWLRNRQVSFRWLDTFFSPRLLLSILSIPIGFAVGAPIALIAWREMIRRMGRLNEYGRFGYHDLLLDPHGGWIFYLKTLAWGAGLLMLVAFIVALVASLIYRSREDLALLVFPLLLYAMMGRQEMFFARFILPALPPLILLVAAWIDRLSQRLEPGISYRTVFATSAMLLMIQPLAMSIWLGVVLNRPDTREVATDWIRTHIPEGSVIYADTYAFARNSVMGRISLPYVWLEDLSFDYPGRLAYFQERGVQFIVTSDYYNELGYTDTEKEMGRKSWLADLSRLNLIQEFQPYWHPDGKFSVDQRYGPSHRTLLRRYPGPVIRIYASDTKPNWHGLNPFMESNQMPGKASVFGYEIAPQVSSGDALDVAIYWLNKGWGISDDLIVALVDSEGFVISHTIARPASGFEEGHNRKGEIIKSKAHLLIPLGTPPGTYKLRLEVYDHDKFQTLGALLIEQTHVTVAKPTPLVVAASESLSPGASLAPGITLVTYELSVPDSLMQDTLVLGQDNWMALLWRVDRDIDLDYTVRLMLIDVEESVVAVWEGQPVHNTYATSNWKAGELIRDPWNLKLPQTIPSGLNCRLVMALLDHEGNIVSEQELGTMRVSARVRNSTVPTMQHSVDAIWGDALRLLGFDLRAVPETADSGWLELDLYWQSVEPIENDYLIGIRLVDSQGQVVLAQEGAPADGRAPTSTWQSAEVVHDFHALHYRGLAMNEEYGLEVLLVDSQTGELLLVAGDGGISDSLIVALWP